MNAPLRIIATLALSAVAAYPVSAQQVVSNACFALADGGVIDNVLDSAAQDVAATIDKVSGVVTPLGTTGLTGTFDGESLAFWPNTSTLFTFDAEELCRLNITTGAKTILGSPGTINGPLGAIAVTDIDGLTLDASVSPPRMFASLRRSANGANDLLMVINTNNGSVVANYFGAGRDYLVVSNYTASGGRLCDDIDDIAIDPATDIMYAILNDGGSSDQLVTINLSNGSVNRIGELTKDDMEGLAFYIDGTLFGSTGKNAPTDQLNRVWDIDKTSGVATNPRQLNYDDIEGLSCFTANASLIGDFVWRDTNRDGDQDPGEPGVANVTVRIYRSSDDALLGTKTTDTNGRYSFIEPTGSYYVIFTAPSGYAFTTQDAAGDTVDSDANPATGRSHTFSVPLNGNDLTIDAGLVCLNPVIVCPPNVVLECPAGGTGTNVTGVATATSPCGCAVTVTFSDVTTPGCGATFSITRTWTATDACGGTSSCQQTIEIQDNTKPTLVGVPADTTVECDSVPNPPAVTANDACDNNVPVDFSTSTTPGNCPGRFTIIRTWTATDDCGNTDTHTQEIIVQDTVRPTLDGVPGPGSYECDSIPAPPVVTAIDNCDNVVPVTLDVQIFPGTCSNRYTIVRTWTATDDCGNERSQNQTLTIVDTTAPVLSGQGADATIQCPATPSFTAPTATDACDTTPTVTHADVTTPGTCPQEYSVTRTWTATDACGNSSQVSQTITVEDNTAPVLSGQGADATIQCPATPSFTAPTATDACGTTPTITHADVTTPGTCPQEYSVTRTWTATDDCGNSSQVSQKITVEDNTAPVLSGQGADATIQCPATPSFTAPTATDACDTTPTVTHADVTTPGTCPQEYAVTRTWTATDDCGNSSQVSQTITVEDNTAPVLSGQGADSTIQCPATPSFTAPTATDACDTTPTVTHADVTTPGTCPQEYSVTRTWTATDDCGNSSQVSQTITVEDNTAPVLSGQGGPATIQCPAAPSFTAPTATDACDTTPTVTHADVTTPGTCPQEYSVTRTWTATDDCGNSSQVSQTISVEDNTAPVLSGQGADATIQCPATPSFTAPTALDACDTTPTITFADVTTPGNCPAEYSVTRTWTAEDDCGNTSQVSQKITVEDNTAPVLSGQGADATIQCPATPSFTAPTALDACDTTPTITFADVTTPGECPQEYSVTRTWTATDDCGNSSQVSQTVTVEDTTPPSIVCPADIILQGDGLCNAEVPLFTPTSFDACGSVTVTQNPPAGTIITGPGDTVVTLTSTDACGNVAQCTVRITISCRSALGDLVWLDKNRNGIQDASETNGVENVTVILRDGVTLAAIATNTTSAAGIYGFVDLLPDDYVVEVVPPPGYAFSPVNASTNTLIDSDIVPATGRTVSFFLPGNVTDLSRDAGLFCLSPVITCPPDLNLECPASTATNSTGVATATSPCGCLLEISYSDSVAPGCGNTFVLTRTWSATDRCGNTATCVQTITVEDNTAPVLSGQGGPATIQCPATPSFTAPTATDACDTTPTITHADVTTPGTCPQEYSVTRTWTATDDCGNSSQVSQTITVEDNTAPVLSGQGAAATIQCPATPSFTAPTATDACDTTPTITHADITTPGNCPAQYAVTRTWTATDDCGNSSQVSQKITVEDTTAPVITGVGGPLTIECNQPIVFSSPTATDACDTTPTLTFVDATVPGTCPQNFVRTRTWTATDDCGNSRTASQAITVRDTTAPVLSGQGADATIQCPATPSFTAPTATDACDTTPTITHADVTTPGTCPQEYSVTRTWTATDDCGNSSQVSQTITVEDNTAPVLSGQGAAATIQCPATPSFTAPTATDACDTTPTITHADVTTPGTCPQEYSVTRTWTATDDCGNSSQVSQTITVEDNTAPVLSGQGAAATIQCPATPSFTAPTATDACDTTPTITHADVTTPGTCPQEYSVTRTWTATDDCGNSSQVSQTITVEDNTAPVLSGQGADATIQCPATPSFTGPTALDACDTTPTITFADVTTPGNCPAEYSVTRTWTATDDCGNSRQVSQTITVEDNTAPVLSGQGAAATIQCPATPSFTAPTATDACDTTPTITFADVTTPGECPQEYSVTRTWTATDDCGNSSQVSQTITVEDTTPPTITCPAPVTVNCISLVPPPNPASVTAADLCGTVAVIHVGDTFTGTTCNRIITRTYRATDACGNAATCTQTITVIDNVRPVQTGFLQDRIFQCVTSLNTFTPVPPTVVDNCDGPLVAPAPTILNDFSPLNCGRTRRYIWTFRDACGNQLRITQTLFVRDTGRPTITCPAPLTLQGDAECKAVLPALVPSVNDNCGAGGVTITQSPPAGTVLTGPGSTTVTLTARDACGNTATCPATVTVNCGTPVIELIKTVYPGHDAGEFCPGAELVISTNNAPVTYCFEVKNTGALNLINVVLQDNTLGMPAINVGNLAVGQSRMFSADSLITANFTNVAQVAGTSVTGVPVSDSDDAAVGKIRPQIQIVKTVAYGDNAPCPGLDFIYAVNGQPVTYCFVVTNLGDVPLRQVVITDDDIGMSPIPLGDLAVGQSKPAKISVIANGSLTNTAWTVGLPPVGPPVTDDDPAEILALGPAVKFGKTTYIGHDAGARCPGGDLALINGPNTPVTFCFEVKNTGDVTLYNVEVSDAGLGYNSIVGILNPGQTVLLHAEAFLNGPVTNVARVTVLPPSGGAFFVDDEAFIDSARPEIRIDKTVAAGYGGYSSCVLDSVETLNLPAPGAVTYCFKVRNTGNTHLNNLAINDLNLGIQEFDMEYVGPAFPLPPGAEAMYMVKAFASSSMINQVQTTAVPTDAQGANIPGQTGVGDVDQAEVVIPVQP